jgi:hypothetical protein
MENQKKIFLSIIEKKFKMLLDSPLYLGFTAYFLIIILNFSCLDNPPYWDDIMGLHNQAVWLAKHNFNFSGLWQPGQGFWEGGSNIYRFGIIPLFYGIMYSFFSPVMAHIIGHLFNMACIALAFGAGYSLLCKLEVDKVPAFLWSLAALCEPVMSGRVVALGQECPLIAATVCSIYFIVEQKYWKGILFIFIAMLCKMTAGVLAIAFSVWLVLEIALGSGRRKELLKRNYALFTGAILLVAVFVYDSFIGTIVNFGGNKLALNGFFERMFFNFIVMLPIQAIILLIILCCAAWKIFKIFKDKNYSRLSGQENILLLLLILIGGYWTSFALYFCSLPRYTGFIVFPMFIFAALCFRKKRLSMIAALFMLIIGLLNVNGRLYFPLRSYFSRSGDRLERSREYLQDLWANQAACKLLETRFFNRPVVAKWPFVQMLTMPEMGYVSKPLPDVYSATSIQAKYLNVKAYRHDAEMPDNTLYVFGFNTLESVPVWGPSLLPKRELRYKIILKNSIRGGWFVIYEKEPEWKRLKRLKSYEKKK